VEATHGDGIAKLKHVELATPTTATAFLAYYQTGLNWPNNRYSTSSPGFADGDQQTELNQTLSNGGR